MTLRIAGAASAPRPVLMTVRRFKLRLMATSSLRLASRTITQVECITDQANASAPCPTMRDTRHCGSPEILEQIHQRAVALRPREFDQPRFMARGQGLDPHQRFLAFAR